MKSRSMLYPILVSLLVFSFLSVWFLMSLPIDTGKHTNYEWLASIASIVGGFFGPVISIFGFSYFYLTFRDSRLQRRIASMVSLMEKYEARIDEELNLKIYNKKLTKDAPWETTVGQNIALSNPNNIEIAFYYDSECKSETDLLVSYTEIKKKLFHLATYCEKALSLGADMETSLFYKLKYSDIVSQMDDSSRILGQAYAEYKKTTKILSELSAIDDKCKDFYSETGKELKKTAPSI